MGFLEDEEKTLSDEKKTKISEQDVRRSFNIHTVCMTNLRQLYGISDVVRGASRVVIVLPDPKGGKCKGLKLLNVAGSATLPDN